MVRLALLLWEQVTDDPQRIGIRGWRFSFVFFCIWLRVWALFCLRG